MEKIIEGEGLNLIMFDVSVHELSTRQIKIDVSPFLHADSFLLLFSLLFTALVYIIPVVLF